jgi:hypothetical protein
MTVANFDPMAKLIMKSFKLDRPNKMGLSFCIYKTEDFSYLHTIRIYVIINPVRWCPNIQQAFTFFFEIHSQLKRIFNRKIHRDVEVIEKMPSNRKTQSAGKSTSPPEKRKRSQTKPDSKPSIRGQQPIPVERPKKDPNVEYDPYFTGSVVRCGAFGKTTGNKCKNLAMDNGRCRMHGGNAGPPDGNKNAVTHGLYERILFSAFEDEEIALWENQKSDVMSNLIVTIRIISIREFRMLKRIESLKNAGDFTVTEKTREHGEGEKGDKDMKTVKREGTLGQIQAIESELTKVQTSKAKLLEFQHRLENAAGKSDVPNFDRYMQALAKSAADVWDTDDGDDGE